MGLKNFSIATYTIQKCRKRKMGMTERRDKNNIYSNKGLTLHIYMHFEKRRRRSVHYIVKSSKHVAGQAHHNSVRKREITRLKPTVECEELADQESVFKNCGCFSHVVVVD